MTWIISVMDHLCPDFGCDQVRAIVIAGHDHRLRGLADWVLGRLAIDNKKGLAVLLAKHCQS